MDYAEIEKLSENAKQKNVFIKEIKDEIGKVIVGQEHLIDCMIISFIAGGHILVEGLPGLAKTFTVKAFSKVIGSGFKRIQFTPDLLPADLIGTRMFNPGKMEFFTKKGPVFTNLLLADEINRAPAKVQSALLQAMEERQVTIGDDTFPLEKPFMVLATENPIEQEGTYPLPEAQLDRFFMKVLVSYPTAEEEKELIGRFGEIREDRLKQTVFEDTFVSAAELVDSIYMDEKLIDYIVALVGQTRNPDNAELRRYLNFGASPRASIALMKASRCMAFMEGRGFVTPDDVKAVGYDVLRHRIILSYEAEADGRKPDDIIKTVFDSVQVP